MEKLELLKKIGDVERIAAASKVHRMFARPVRYANSVLFRKTSYKKNKKEKEVRCKTFFGSEMNLLLPSSTDIYLTGGKSHFSEIKLAKYLIKNLNAGEGFFDIGAHYGYFSMLASKVVGENGLVTSFEATPRTFEILSKNIERTNNVLAFNKVISDSDGNITFYEFPNLYSEYNSMDISQFENAEWIKHNRPREIELESVKLSDYLFEAKKPTKIIKIDVEGAEFQVVKGAAEYLEQQSPIIALEFLPANHGYKGHALAEGLLRSLGYASYELDHNGDEKFTNDIYASLKSSGLESDNIIFRKG